jgi:hypothetical protein
MNRTKAALAISEHLRPGDVINTGWKMNWWDIFKPNKWLRNIASWRIQEYQKAYFGKESVWDSTHTRIYLGTNKSHIHSEWIFEVTDPVAQMVSLYSIALEDIRILRYTGKVINTPDAKLMRHSANRIVNSEYDEGQLFDFLLHQILGYPKEPFTLFDLGNDRTVCSAGVATLFNRLRKILNEKDGDTIPRLFDIVNVNLWKERGVFDNIDQCLDPEATPGVDSIRTAIERVTPAHFENTEYFQNEFTEVARFKNGKRYYYWPIKPDVDATSTNKE